ncbi:Hint domain-containing protein [Roseobacter sp. YSTF-M11]|uniref:Hint domain-containing protein n=1 Tax=Roseobacter insulae TaxID=2859783 RepID=A0A9X1FWX4_9RHOB|nr:Hint domain-containing protein [Roseobacter insulae]MBW4708797.1 Hint domain-containing protein [Roseobacter insulae]
MVLRTFIAFDNDSLVVTSSANGGLVGNPVVNNSDTPDGTVFQYSSASGTQIELNDTGGGASRFNDDNAGNHVITDGGGIVANGTAVESESILFLRALDSSGNQTGPEISVYVFSQNGNFNDIWGYATSEPLQDGVSYVKIDGSNSGTSRYTDYVTCFADGTLIAGPDGEVAVEDIEKGQLIWTRDNGMLPVQWIGTTAVAGHGAFAPVVFEAGAIGNETALTVSQQHRIWVESAMAELLFGKSEVLVAAKHLCGLPGVSLQPREQVTYTHFMFGSHQIVRANGALTESFFLADNALRTLEAGPQAELRALFASADAGFRHFGTTATMTLTAREAAALKPYLSY